MQKQGKVTCKKHWVVPIYVTDAYKWQGRFQNHCALGYTIQQSVNHADSYSDYYDNSSIKNHNLYGNRNLVLKVSKAAPLEIDSERETFAITEGFDFYPDREDFSQIFNLLSNKISDFDPGKYHVIYTQNQLHKDTFVIDLVLKVGEFFTSSGYTLVFNYNTCNEIFDNTIELKKPYEELVLASKKLTLSHDSEDNAKTQSLPHDASKNVLSQTISLYYDILADSFFYNVFTIYQYQDTEGIGAYNNLVSIE